MQYPTIAHQIIALKTADLQLRNQLIQNKELGKGYHPDMERLHNKNAEILSGIIDEIGYPTIDKVGEKGNKAAWLVIQHAIGQPDFMKKGLRMLKEAVVGNEANPKGLAYLSDRIAVFEGQPQRYGTQFDWDENGALSPSHFDDLAKVNQRRKSIGLNTLEEQTEIIRRRATQENEAPPQDYARRKAEMDAWRKSVGWIS